MVEKEGKLQNKYSIHPWCAWPRMDQHANNRPIKTNPKEVAMINLEADSFKLLESRIDYDLQCLRVARARLEAYDGEQFTTKPSPIASMPMRPVNLQ